MINKFFQIIHRKFPKIFNFIFFLRYLFVIFFISISLFVSIPKFFNYEKKQGIIKDYLLRHYSLKLNNISNIDFNSFPLPHLEINNVNLDFGSEKIKLKTNKLEIYPKFVSIFNYENFQINKIKIYDNKTSINFNNLQNFLKDIIKLKKKILIDNLDVRINEKNTPIVKIDDLYFTNYGYKKNIISGKIFNKNFTLKLKNDFTKVHFDLINSGVSFVINLSNDSFDKVEGTFKAKVLRSNFKSNFNYEANLLNINNSFFRNRNLSFDSDGNVRFKPYFKINLNTDLKNINFNILKDLNYQKIVKNKKLIKKLNIENNLSYRSARFKNDIIDDFKLKYVLAHGQLSFLKKISISSSVLNCNGNLNIIDEFPKLYFNCLLISKNKANLLRKFNIKYENKNEKLNIKFNGSLNFYNKKINFKLIEMNKNYKASKEDLKYFKENFENLVLNENFFEIFNLLNIKKFLEEII